MPSHHKRRRPLRCQVVVVVQDVRALALEVRARVLAVENAVTTERRKKRGNQRKQTILEKKGSS